MGWYFLLCQGGARGLARCQRGPLLELAEVTSQEGGIGCLEAGSDGRVQFSFVLSSVTKSKWKNRHKHARPGNCWTRGKAPRRRGWRCSLGNRMVPGAESPGCGQELSLGWHWGWGRWQGREAGPEGRAAGFLASWETPWLGKPSWVHGQRRPQGCPSDKGVAGPWAGGQDMRTWRPSGASPKRGGASSAPSGCRAPGGTPPPLLASVSPSCRRSGDPCASSCANCEVGGGMRQGCPQ